MDPNHNLLFALAAVAAGKVSPGQLAAAARIRGDGDGVRLGEQLVIAGFMTPSERDSVGEAVERELRLRNGNTLAAFAALWRRAAVSPTLSDAFAEPDTPETIAVSDGPSPDPPPDSPPDTLAPGISAATALPMQPLEPVEPEENGPTGDDILAAREHPGRYREIRTFAKGGMGRILLMHDTHIGRDVAFKQLLPEPGDSPGSVPSADLITVPLLTRFLQEARITGQLEHPSIVPVYELGCRPDGSLYYTMRLVKGRTLEEEIAARPDLSGRLSLLTHFLDLCQAVAYAHSRGVIHRDLRPLNVLIGGFGETALIDWSIAKVRGVADIHADELRETVVQMRMADAEATVKTAYGQSPAFPCHMPPEQAAGNLDAVDERSDIYALGTVLYHLLTGHPPYEGLTVREFLGRVAEFQPRPVRQLEPRAPAELAAICARAMARRPEDRYASARELAEEVRRYVSGGFVTAYEYHLTELAARFAARHRRALAAGAAALLIMAATGIHAGVRVYREHKAALVQARLAVAERGRAVEARSQAELARDAAETAKSAAELDRTRAEHELYFANIALAQRSVQESRMGQARALLDSAPTALRDWEWRHLVREANADSMALRTGGMFAAFCDGGRQLVTARPNGTVVANDLATGETRRTFVESGGIGCTLAVDTAGERLAVSCSRQVAVWNVADGTRLFCFEEPEDALTRNFLALSADGRRVAALNTDRTLRVWEVDTGTVIHQRAVASQQGFDLWLAPAGDRLLLATAELGDAGLVRAVSLLGLPAGKKIGQTELADAVSIHGATFSPDGARVALALDNAVQIWDTGEWKLVRELDGRFGHPDALAFSPDGALLAAGTMDGDVLLWDRGADHEVRVSKAHSEAIRKIAFRPDGKWLATAGFDRVARIWECPGLQPVQALRGHDRPILSIGFNPGGDRLVTGSFDGTSRVWDLTRELQYLTPAAVAANGAAGLIAGAVDGVAVLWNAKTGKREAVLDTAGARIRLLAFDRAGSRLAAAVETGPRDRSVIVWNVSEKSVATRVPTRAEADRIEFTGNLDQYIAVRAGSCLDVYDAASGSAVWKLAGVLDLAFGRDGGQLAVCSLPEDPTLMREQQEVTLYATEGWNRTAQFTVPTSFTAALTWSPDNRRLALGAQVLSEKEWRGGAYLWNLDHPEHPQWLQGHDALVCAVAFDPAGARMATGGKDGRLVLWQLDSASEMWKTGAHTSDIQDLAFSPEGTRIVTAGRDGAFKLWNTEDGREVLALQASANGDAHDATPAKVCFDPQSRYLLTVTEPVLKPPLFHWAVPSAFTGPADAPLQDRIEAWKRAGAP